MIVELWGAGTHNKGAELMTLAVLDRFGRGSGKLEFAVDPLFGTPQRRASYGLKTKLRSRRFGRSSLLIPLMSESFRRTYGLVNDSDVGAVFDVCGFNYGDAWGARQLHEFARRTRQWKRRGAKVVLLPQAFGPFNDRAGARAFAEGLECVDLVFARDATSREHLRQLVDDQVPIRVAPDFTANLKGTLPVGFEPRSERAWIVPNVRMIDKAGDVAAKTYLPFLVTCIESCAAQGLEPAILVHSLGDERLARQLTQETREPCRVVHETDPLCIKGMLGTGRLVIASRYHALISALAQNVPCIGTSWTHKYRTLFEEYECSQMLLPTESPKEIIQRRLETAESGAQRDRLVSRFREINRQRADEIEEMWRYVERHLGIQIPHDTTLIQGGTSLLCQS